MSLEDLITALKPLQLKPLELLSETFRGRRPGLSPQLAGGEKTRSGISGPLGLMDEIEYEIRQMLGLPRVKPMIVLPGPLSRLTGLLGAVAPPEVARPELPGEVPSFVPYPRREANDKIHVY